MLNQAFSINLELLSLTSRITVQHYAAYFEGIVLLRALDEFISEMNLTNSLLPSDGTYLVHLVPFILLKTLILVIN